MDVSSSEPAVKKLSALVLSAEWKLCQQPGFGHSYCQLCYRFTDIMSETNNWKPRLDGSEWDMDLCSDECSRISGMPYCLWTEKNYIWCSKQTTYLPNIEIKYTQLHKTVNAQHGCNTPCENNIWLIRHCTSDKVYREAVNEKSFHTCTLSQQRFKSCKIILKTVNIKSWKTMHTEQNLVCGMCPRLPGVDRRWTVCRWSNARAAWWCRRGAGRLLGQGTSLLTCWLWGNPSLTLPTSRSPWTTTPSSASTTWTCASPTVMTGKLERGGGGWGGGGGQICQVLDWWGGEASRQVNCMGGSCMWKS